MKSFIRRISLFIAFFLTIASFLFLTIFITRYTSSQISLEKVLLDSDKKICKAFFSPDDEIRDILIELINSEKKSITAAIYTFTEKNIAKAFVDAYKRGVKVEFVVDRTYGSDKYSKVPYVANNHIPVWVYQTSQDTKAASLMHHKFCIFEDNILNKSILFTGSFNFTQKASLANQENVIILDCYDIIQRFKSQFDILKTRSILISGKPGQNYKQEVEVKEVSILQKIGNWFSNLIQ